MSAMKAAWRDGSNVPFCGGFDPHSFVWWGGTAHPVLSTVACADGLCVGPTTRVAEREGFEPSVECNPHTRLAGEHHRPARSSLRSSLAEGVGFEPTVLSYNGFQDRRLKPLGHPSEGFSLYHLEIFLSILCHCQTPRKAI